jgi:hypothetical protein
MHKYEIRNVDTAKALSIMVFESMSIYTHRKSDTLPIYLSCDIYIYVSVRYDGYISQNQQREPGALPGLPPI